jgi:outer membrane protein assembly factor BamD
VANYYFKRGAYLAATNRGKFVVENFQGSPAVPDGLAVMAQGYTLLGYTEQAKNAVEVLAHNYPDHPALNPDGSFRYQDMEGGLERSWLNRLTLGMLDRPEELGFDTRELYNPQYQD